VGSFLLIISAIYVKNFPYNNYYHQVIQLKYYYQKASTHIYTRLEDERPYNGAEIFNSSGFPGDKSLVLMKIKVAVGTKSHHSLPYNPLRD
ncbi:MAG: hypothetical protein ACFFD2_24125, partial [Promethearchaeota archaeon]